MFAAFPQDLKGEGGEKDLDELLAKCLMSLLSELKPVDPVHLNVVQMLMTCRMRLQRNQRSRKSPQGITGVQVIYRACSVYSQGKDGRGN